MEDIEIEIEKMQRPWNDQNQATEVDRAFDTGLKRVEAPQGTEDWDQKDRDMKDIERYGHHRIGVRIIATRNQNSHQGSQSADVKRKIHQNRFFGTQSGKKEEW